MNLQRQSAVDDNEKKAIVRENASIEMQVIDFQIPSEMKWVTPTVAAAQRFAWQRGAHSTMGLALALRELLTNAVEHGNHCDPTRFVYCRVSTDVGGVLRIDVEDEGEGFDHRTLERTLPEDPRRVRQRGYLLVFAVCQEVHFNDKGNRVSVLLTM